MPLVFLLCSMVGTPDGQIKFNLPLPVLRSHSRKFLYGFSCIDWRCHFAEVVTSTFGCYDTCRDNGRI